MVKYALCKAFSHLSPVHRCHLRRCDTQTGGQQALPNYCTCGLPICVSCQCRFCLRVCIVRARDSSMESKLFDSVWYNTNHVLHQLLPPVKDTHYNLRQRSHSLTFPSEDNNLIRKNFLHRMLFRDITSCLYCIIAFHFQRFNVYAENFQSYVPLHLYVC